MEEPIRIIVPPPFAHNAKPVEIANINEIKLDEQGILLGKFFDYTSFMSMRTTAYDQCIEDIWTIIHQTSFKTLDGSSVTFRDRNVSRPIINISTHEHLLLPQLARKKDLTYDLALRTTLVKSKDGIEETSPDVLIGNIPLMLGSKHCYLHGKTPMERQAMGEDIDDPLGYFVVKGNEKMLPLGEMLRYNKIFLYRGSVRTDCVITCMGPVGTKIVRIFRHPEKGTVELELAGFMKSVENSKNNNTIGVLQMFYLLGMTDPTLIMNNIMMFTKPKHRSKLRSTLAASLNVIFTVADHKKFIGDKMARSYESNHAKKTIKKDKKNKDEQKNVLKPFDVDTGLRTIIQDELFPHINGEDPSVINRMKINLLSIMVVKLAEFHSGVRKHDDRDSWSNKKIRTDGQSITQLFRFIWREVTASIQEDIEKRANMSVKDIARSINANSKIKETMETSFYSNSWGIRNKHVRNDITQILKREGLLATLSHLTTIDVTMSDNNKNPAIRMVQNTQYGFCCSVETPEGSKVGITKHTAITAGLSTTDSETSIRTLINSDFTDGPSLDRSTMLICNGKFLGFTDGKTLNNKLVDLRRKSLIPRNTSIAYDFNEDVLHLYTDEGRLNRPLLVVNRLTGKLVIDEVGWDKPWNDLVSQGAIEYVDPLEQEYLLIAVYLNDVRKLYGPAGSGHVTAETVQDISKEIKIRPFTHCEVDPTALLGFAASIIPSANHNQGPRLVFQASMGKQALGTYHSNHGDRFDGTTKVLAFPSRPIYEPQMNQFIGLNNKPSGSMVNVTIGVYKGYTQEDAFIFNRASVDRGMFRIMKYVTYDTRLKSMDVYTERLQRPSSKTNDIPGKFDMIGANGLPRIGQYIKEGQCVIGKVQVDRNGNVVRDSSVYVETGKSGRVDTIIIDNGMNAETVVKVKLREYRRPEAGDKFAPRYAQKGTIGIVVPEEDLPFSSNNKASPRPDIMINPHSIPARMTMAYLMEILGSKAAAFTGERINATAFRPFKHEEFETTLRDNGFTPKGTELMYSGMSGRPMEVALFRGPAYFQALKHHVLDKIQMRHVGSIKLTTHAPSGSSKRSGLRFGEMERDNIISHGATKFLNERLVSGASGFEASYCRTCGWLAIINASGGNLRCKRCKNDAKFGRVQVPYTYLRLSHYLNGLGLGMTLKILTNEEYGEVKKNRYVTKQDTILTATEIAGINKDEEEEANLEIDESDAFIVDEMEMG